MVVQIYLCESDSERKVTYAEDNYETNMSVYTRAPSGTPDRQIASHCVRSPGPVQLSILIKEMNIYIFMTNSLILSGKYLGLL